MSVRKIWTPEAKRKDRETRNFANFDLREVRAEEDGPEELYVEGYAARFSEPTVLWEFDGVEYKEQIDPEAFDEADMSDVIFNYNHGGKVMARTRNGTLELRTDKEGLFIQARLDGTQEGRNLYEEIRGGYIDKMSFQFTVKESSYDREERMRTITRVKKVYDVSAVAFPAYDGTSVSARDFFEAQREIEERLRSRRKRLLVATYL